MIAVVQTVVLTCVARSEPLYSFPIYRTIAVYEHRTFVQRTHKSGQLADYEEILAEFDEVCFGLDWQTTPLTSTSCYSENPIHCSEYSSFIIIGSIKYAEKAM